MYKIKIFEDEERKKLIFEDDIQSIYDDDEIDFNNFDASDWWLSKLEYIEGELNENWRLAVLTSEDGIEAKVISRTEYIAGEVVSFPSTFIPCALLFSPKFLGNKETTFSGNICITSKFKNTNTIFIFDPPFSSSHIQAMAYKYLELKYGSEYFYNNFKNWAHVCEVMNPSEGSLFKAKLCGYHPIINIRNSIDAVDFMKEMMALKSLFSLNNASLIQSHKLTNAGINAGVQEGAQSKIEQLMTEQFELMEDKYFY